MKVHTRRKRAGFSLTELLVVIGIVAILMGLAVPAVLYYQRELKLTELDDNARAIFIAAQNHLTALRSANAGELEVGTDVGRPTEAAPGTVNELAGTELKYVSTDAPDAPDSDPAKVAKPGWLVLPGSIEGDLAQGHYLVEFDPKSGSVYGVFFTRDTELNESGYQKLYQHADDIRARAGRKSFASASGGFFVGYYGADGALDMTRPDSEKLPKPKLTLTNAEELVLKIDMDALPDEITPGKVFASVSVTDGTATRTLVDKGAILSGTANRVVLDTLKSYPSPGLNTAGWTAGNSFAGWMASGDSYVITPGKDITVTVSIFYDDAGAGIVALPQSASVNTNSLFASRSGDTVQVAYGRHLQNLHPDVSKLDSTVTKAQQVRAIDFAKTGSGLNSWADTYGHNARRFVPISNVHLDSYKGNGLTIQNLYAVKASGEKYENAGLFGVFSGTLLENIVLVDARAVGSNAAGTLAGAVSNPVDGVVVDGCQAYLTKYSDTGVRVQGNTAGGLIGTAQKLTTQSGCFASTVVDGAIAGGLVGGGNDMYVSRSYAAGYLSGASVGGVVGRGSAVTIQNCYAAGTIAKATSSAGGLSAGAATARTSYAVVDYGTLPAETAVYGAVPSGAKLTTDNKVAVHYLEKAGINYIASANVDAFTSTDQMKLRSELVLGTQFDDGGTLTQENVHPYNFPVDGVARDTELSDPYPYPNLNVGISPNKVPVPHYGDWLEAEGSNVTSLMAYYEQFLSDAGYVTEYSAFVNGVEMGAIKDASRTEAINADGYAFLSTTRLSEDWEGKTDLTIKAVGMETVESTVRGRYLGALDEDLQPTAEDGAAYYAYAIPNSALDMVPAAGGYNELTVHGRGPEQWGVPTEEAETTAWVTNFFGRAAYNGAKPTSVPNPIHVRSLRHLANVGRFFGVRNYVQDLDIDASIYCGDLVTAPKGNSPAWEGRGQNSEGHATIAGFEVWGCTTSWDGTSTWSYLNYVPERYHLVFDPIGAHDEPGGINGGYDTESSFNGNYNGNGRIIRDLSIQPHYYTTDKVYYTGLFHRVRGNLTNIHVTECDVMGATGVATNSTGALVARLSAGKVEGCTVTDCTITAQGTADKGHMGGLIGYVDDKAELVSDCLVSNCTVDGGKYIHNVGGLIGYINKLNVGQIRDCTVKNVPVSGGFISKNVTKNQSKPESIEKQGSIGGFVGCLSESAGLLENCFVIGTGDSGVSGASWNAGGFAGTISNGKVQNCGVRLEGSPAKSYAKQAVSCGVATGGFVGTLSGGSSSIQSSYAAVKAEGAVLTVGGATVTVSGGAGGFVGLMEDGSVSNCYAGGSTSNGKYTSGRSNVTGTARAGGLVGLWKGGSLDTCYTTCSVSGPNDMATDVFANQSDATAGSAVPNCYALGEAFVNGSKRGSLTKANVATTMTELNESQRTETHPYDVALTTYPYAPVKYADGTSVPHYGDWPEEGLSQDRVRFEWDPQPETFEEMDCSSVDMDRTEMKWNGNSVDIKITTKGSGKNLANLFQESGGHFAITTDLGYMIVFQAVTISEDGSASIYGEGGVKLFDVTPVTQGIGDNFTRTYEFSIPTSMLPDYTDGINIGGYKKGFIFNERDENGEVIMIKNNDTDASDYKPLSPFLPGDTVHIDGDFSDWNGYDHQLLDHTPGDALTSGHVMGSAFGEGNVIYLHVINQSTKSGLILDPNYNGDLTLAITSMKFSVEGYDGWPNDLEWWRLTGQSYTGPGIYKLEVDKYGPNWTWEGKVVRVEAYLIIRENGMQEMEMAIYMDEIAGKENADKITKFRVDFETYGGSLTIERDPPET